jgi:hypothetical protein
MFIFNDVIFFSNLCYEAPAGTISLNKFAWKGPTEIGSEKNFVIKIQENFSKFLPNRHHRHDIEKNVVIYFLQEEI